MRLYSIVGQCWNEIVSFAVKKITIQDKTHISNYILASSKSKPDDWQLTRWM